MYFRSPQCCVAGILSYLPKTLPSAASSSLWLSLLFIFVLVFSKRTSFNNEAHSSPFVVVSIRRIPVRNFAPRTALFHSPFFFCVSVLFSLEPVLLLCVWLLSEGYSCLYIYIFLIISTFFCKCFHLLKGALRNQEFHKSNTFVRIHFFFFFKLLLLVRQAVLTSRVKTKTLFYVTAASAVHFIGQRANKPDRGGAR